MNESNRTFPQQLDRLVDGELSCDQRRELLALIAATENGWRDCALAFLEAQTFESGLQQHFAPVALADSSRIEQKPVQRNREPAPPSAPANMWWVAAAAMLALVFGVTGYAVGWWSRPLPSAPAVIAQPSDNAPPTRDGEFAPIETESATMQMHGDLVMVSGDQQVRVPIYSGQGAAAEWLSEHSAAVSEEYVKLLKQQGNHVKQTRTLATIPLEDGSYVLAPVEQLEVTPVKMQWQ